MQTAIDTVRRDLPALLPRLWRFAVVLCRSAEQAPDLVQATCLRALERAEQFEPGTRLDRWCFAIMASIWKNELRSRSVRLGNGHIDAEIALISDAREILEYEVSVRQVLEVVQSLPEPQRLAVHLVYVEGYSYTDASQFLKIPVGTLMSRLAAAKSAVSQLLGTEAMRGAKTLGLGE